MSGADAARPQDPDRATGGPGGAQDEHRTSREGGDAEAAGSVEEREAVARDEDDTWDPDEDPDERG